MRSGNGGILALSPDGTRLAVTLRAADGRVRLHTRLLRQEQIMQLAGTENASYPFFSPDGEWIGFFADGKLRKISIEGGAAVTLCDAPLGRGASWGDDGIIAALSRTSGLSRVPSVGGMPVPVTTLSPGEITHRWPQVLPGNKAVLFTASKRQGSYDDASIEVVLLKSGQRRTIQHGGFFPRYLPTSSTIGHLVYMHYTSLFAVPFDADRLALRGPLAPILDDVSSSVGAGADFAVAGPLSGPATFVYLAGKGLLGGWAISLLDRTGKAETLHAALGFYASPRFSPNGKRLAFSMTSAQGEDIWVKDLDRDIPSRLSFLGGLNRSPTWSPDGNSIVFQSTNTTAPGLYWIRSDGSGEPLRLSDGKLNEPYSFSPDGKHLAFTTNGNGGSSDIFIAPIEGDSGHPRLGRPELFLGTPFSELYPAFSPDGRWLAYESNETGTPEVYVRPFPGPGGRWQVSTEGGLLPLWSREGRELLFQTFDRRVIATGYTAEGDSFILGKSRVWSEIHLQNLLASNYDVAPNGKLAVMLASGATTEKAPTHLSVLLNFSDELQRRAVVAKP